MEHTPSQKGSLSPQAVERNRDGSKIGGWEERDLGNFPPDAELGIPMKLQRDRTKTQGEGMEPKCARS